jgi:hypothetical protein
MTHNPDDSLVVEGQAQRKVTLVRHFARFAPASDLTSPGKDVTVNILELRLRLFDRELLVSARLLKHLPARRDATKGSARGLRFRHRDRGTLPPPRNHAP